MIASPIKVREHLTITDRRATIAAYILIRHPHQRFRYLECFPLKRSVANPHQMIRMAATKVLNERASDTALPT